MSPRELAVVLGLAATLNAGAGANRLFAQSTPPAPRPADPAPADPVKPAGPPQGQGPSTRSPRITLGVPSSGASKEKPVNEDAASPAAATFLKKAAEDGRVEIALGRLALSTASNAAVKTYAQMLIADHQQAGDDVVAIAQSKKVTLPKDDPAIANPTLTRLEKLKGAAFDRAYVAAMIDDHKKAIAEFEDAAKSSDRDVKDFASKTLPTLKHHLEEAQKLAKQP